MLAGCGAVSAGATVTDRDPTPVSPSLLNWSARMPVPPTMVSPVNVARPRLSVEAEPLVRVPAPPLSAARTTTPASAALFPTLSSIRRMGGGESGTPASPPTGTSRSMAKRVGRPPTSESDAVVAAVMESARKVRVRPPATPVMVSVENTARPAALVMADGLLTAVTPDPPADVTTTRRPASGVSFPSRSRSCT